MDKHLIIGTILVLCLIYFSNFKLFEKFGDNKDGCCGSNITTKDPNISNLSKRIDLMNSKITNADNTMTKVEKQITEIKTAVQELNSRSASYEKKAKNISKEMDSTKQQNQQNRVKSAKLTKKLEMFTDIGKNIDLLNSQGIFL